MNKVTMLKVLLTHTPQARAQYYGAESLAGLRDVAAVQLHDRDAVLDANDLIEAARHVDVIVADRATAVPAEVFAALPNLKAVVRCAVDIRNIEVAGATTAGVLVTRASPGFVDAVTELTLGYLIDLSRGISRATRAYHAGQNPAIIMGRQVSGSTIGIIGYGSIGRKLAAVAGMLGMSVLVTDPYHGPDDPRFESVSLNELLRRADFVVCLAVANDQTENLLGVAEFAAMQSHAFFINVSRGNLVDERALYDALQHGVIAGAALDVGRAPDQMPSLDLAALPNVIATPHIGGLTPTAISAQSLETVRQVASIVAGEAPCGAVNAEHWTRR
jgi:D-3-phosphoglycerate dehydrogenase / 2-oxoglutarate reductase